MRQTTLLLLTFLLLSCNNKTEKNTTTNTVDSTLTTIQPEKKQTDFYVKDKSKYDKTFLDEISKYTEPVKVIDNYILVGKDTTFFPQDLNLNVETVFKGTKDNQFYELKLTRINYTTISYNFILKDNEKNTLTTRKGKATLGGLFFLGSESDDDEETGEAYFSSEYWETNKDCSFSIRVGDKDEKGRLRANVGLTYENDKSTNNNIDNCPTLRTE